MNYVVKSAEFQRVFKIPRRNTMIQQVLAKTNIRRGVEDRVGISDTIILRDIQIQALYEARNMSGLFAPIGVGHGKTLISLLLPTVINCERPLLIVPAQLRVQTKNILTDVKKQFRIHSNLAVISYSVLSTVKTSDILNEIKPDLIIADECHKLKNRKSARTKRFIRYFRQNPETMFCALSGTITKSSLFDYQHLLFLALGDFAPIPCTYNDIMIWDQVLKAKRGIELQEHVEPGALWDFCEGDETPREGYQRRLTETYGVVATSDSSIGTSLIINKVTPDIPKEIKDAYKQIDKTWTLPNGEEIWSATDKERHLKEIACGFYYTWLWSDNEPNYLWLRARAAWKKFVREIIARNKKGLDSPLQVANYYEDHELNIEWKKWKNHPNQPKTVSKWVSKKIVKQAADWSNNTGGIIWTPFEAFGDMVYWTSSILYFGGGAPAAKELSNYSGPCCLSIGAHFTGKNLQRWSNNLVVGCPSSGALWEQLIGRTHRLNQEADEVNVVVYEGLPVLKKAFNYALEESKYIEQSTGQNQKLSIGRIL